MITAEKIQEIAKKKITGTEIFIVEIKVAVGNKISVRLDKMNGGIVVNDCSEISRYIEANLDRNAEDFSLEVSSAGLEEPFKVKKQYLKNIGKKIDVLLTDGIRKEGKLVLADENKIELETTHRDKHLKKDTTEIIGIAYDQIKQTKKIISFK